jgi:benzodiazapine receptor
MSTAATEGIAVRIELPPRLPRTSAAVLVTAVIGSLGTDVRSDWYRSLRKPEWQPPGAAFGPAWTTLYGLMSLSSARVLDRMDDSRERRAFTAAFGTNLVLNAAWNWLFFTARRPRWALVEIVLLEASTVDLTRRAGRSDTAAGTMLLPYAGWVAFAAALNAAIARRNPPLPPIRRTGTADPRTP